MYIMFYGTQTLEYWILLIVLLFCHTSLVSLQLKGKNKIGKNVSEMQDIGKPCKLIQNLS